MGEGIALDRWGYPVVTGAADAGGRRRALRAAAACPRGAIVVEEMTDDGLSRPTPLR